ncbi:calcium-binding protein [Acinetobacter sp. LCT-H3]|uniref:calcium-binding protein n=1 Tax=Acinetobacter sp. LCT-H3 TaxID=1914307 RepID=UPI00115FB25F|nr:calcium-binding protein [Acinetobacter sp. LCT-H3]
MNDELLVLANNNVQAILNVEPLEIDNPPLIANSTGLTIVGAKLGGVLDANVLGDVLASSTVINVDENTERLFTLQGDVVGVFAGTMDLYVYKQNPNTQVWEQHEYIPNWFGGFIAGGSEPTPYTLGEGNWLFALSVGGGIAAVTGYTLSFEDQKVLDYGQAINVSGLTEGNVILDDDFSYGQDNIPAGSAITSIIYKGQSYDVDSINGLEIEADYGVFNINGSGEYSYSIDPDFREYGEREVFTYVVTTPKGITASADLQIELNVPPKSDPVEIDNTVIVDSTPSLVYDIIVSDYQTNSAYNVLSFSLLDLDLGIPSVLNASALSGDGTYDFSVAENQLRELSFYSSTISVGGGINVSLVVYKLDDTTGQYIQVHLEENWYNVIALGANSGDDWLKLSFGEGQYKAIIIADAAIGVGTTTGLYVRQDTVYDYNSPANFTGSVDGDVTPDSGTVISVDGTNIDSTEAEINGEYGVLRIKSDGTYTYEVAVPDDRTGWVPPYGQIERFNVVVEDENGNKTVEVLNIRIATHGTNDDLANEIVFNKSGVVKDLGTSDSFTLSTDISETINFTIDPGSKLLGGSLDFAVTNSTVNGVVEITYKLYKVNPNDSSDRELIDSKIETAGAPITTLPPSAGAEGNPSMSINFDDLELESGLYSIELSGTRPTSSFINWNYTFNGATVSELQYVAHSAAIEGSILSNDIGNQQLDSLAIGSYTLYVNDVNKGADSISINGLYGTLVLSKNGSYIYIANGTGSGIETFTYKTTSYTGQTETAELKIDVTSVLNSTNIDNAIRVDGTNQASGTIGDDILIGGISDDALNGNQGNDTLIGGYGNDILNGGDGNDILHGGAGDDTLNGRAGNDIIIGGAGNDTITGGTGADKVIFNLLDASDNTGGNGQDTWTDFNLAEGDTIDISGLLADQNITDISKFVFVEQSNGNTIVKFDLDGDNAGTSLGYASLITLQNNNVSLEQLLENNQLLY